MALLKFLVPLILIISGLYYLFSEKEIRYEPGTLIEQEPIQTALKNPDFWYVGDHKVSTLYDFVLVARVLGKKSYSSDQQSEVSPLDLVLGWQEMSDQFHIDRTEIDQSMRFYWFAYPDSLSKKRFTQITANMHILPANPEIEQIADDIVKGDIIALKGQLVSVAFEGGWNWKSSTSRNDIGNGSCEIVWVEKLQIVTDRYADRIVN